MAKIEVKEKQVEEKFDSVSANLAYRMGYDEVPWIKATWSLLWLYTILTIFVMYYRPDFVNLTICISAIYMLFNTHILTRTRFRFLVGAIFLSILYDILFILMMASDY